MAPSKTSKIGPNISTWLSGEDWRERILTFDPSWYIVNMGTGIIVQLLALNFPYPAQWLKTIGYIFWIADIVIFGFFTLMSALRAIMYPKVALSVLDDFQQTGFLGAVPIAWETIGTGIYIFYTNDAGIIAAEIFFWIAVVMTFITTCGGVYSMYHKQGEHEMNEVTGVWFLLFIAMIVCGAFGSGLAAHTSIKNSGVIVIVSSLMVSLGMGLSFLVLGIYLWRLMVCKLPAREAIVSTFVPIGPPSMSAYVYLNISVALSKDVTEGKFDFRRPWALALDTADSNNAVQDAVSNMILWIGVILCIMLLGVAIFWVVEAFASIATKVPTSFNVGWWSFVFPLGVFSNAWGRLSVLLRNEGMKGWAVACIVVTVLFWLLCASCTLYKGVWCGKLFYAPGLQGWIEQKAWEKMERDKHTSDNPETGAADKEAGEASSNDLNSSNEGTNKVTSRKPGNDGTYSPSRSTSKEDGKGQESV